MITEGAVKFITFAVFTRQTTKVTTLNEWSINNGFTINDFGRRWHFPKTNTAFFEAFLFSIVLKWEFISTYLTFINIALISIICACFTSRVALNTNRRLWPIRWISSITINFACWFSLSSCSIPRNCHLKILFREIYTPTFSTIISVFFNLFSWFYQFCTFTEFTRNVTFEKRN